MNICLGCVPNLLFTRVTNVGVKFDWAPKLPLFLKEILIYCEIDCFIVWGTLFE